ncbi:MAG: ABC transporter ATP-binding protein/permease [Bacilli bacterium]|nr:ABC transporter ATP-binding protein/permease [Bacilli bacterium]
MIKIDNVNKYFNRHKKNQIHVINNTSIELEDTGLVALLGPSGCGKTTLLNTIGGLDKINSGTIYINNEKITKRRVGKIDEIRSLNIGYIFQDYHLINDMSVYDNVAMPLKMNGIKNQEEIKRRVNYVLEKVGMYRYRNRPAEMLSGGERQRVGIARAIVKNPKIIIADEPTGNLDSKNTIEVMNIIKAISKNRLVILVTHEKEIAEFYASRIITLSDGTITSDKENNHNEELDYKMDGKIYLKDIKNKVTSNEKNLTVNYYNDHNEKLDLNIVLKNGNIYIETSNKEKVQVIGEDSSIELIDDNYKKISKSIYEDYKFNFKEFTNSETKEKYSSIYNIITLLKQGFKKVFNYGIIKKLLLMGFFASAMFIMFSVSTILASLKIKDEDFIKYNKNYLVIKDNKISLEEYNNYLEVPNISYILPGSSMVNFTVGLDDYFQTRHATANLSGSLSSIEMISEKDIILGRMVEKENEIIVDKWTLNNLINSNNAKEAGYLSYEEFLNKQVNVSEVKYYTIVGIVDLSSPSIYVKNEEFITIINNSSQEDMYYDVEESKIQDFKLLADKIQLTKGTWPENDYEVIINENYSEQHKIGSTIDYKINNNKLKVVGYYHSNTDIEKYLVNENTIKYDLITNKSDLVVYAKDKEEALKHYKEQGLNIKDAYKQSKEDYIEGIKPSIISKLIFSGTILIISLIEIFLIIRSSFLSRIKEVGILRAIGVKKGDIYKMFSGEILAITIVASTPGIILMSYILKQLSTTSFFSRTIAFDSYVLTISIILILGFNLIFGLIPVFTTMRKTPAGILSRTDLE